MSTPTEVHCKGNANATAAADEHADAEMPKDEPQELESAVNGRAPCGPPQEAQSCWEASLSTSSKDLGRRLRGPAKPKENSAPPHRPKPTVLSPRRVPPEAT